MDIMKMMKQVQEIQAKAQQMQAELEAMEIAGQAGAGSVLVRLNGKGEMLGVKLDPALLKPEEADILEDLIVAAHKDARSKVDAAMQDKMKQVTGGLPIPPGFKLF
jgi:hypothetical protein